MQIYSIANIYAGMLRFNNSLYYATAKTRHDLIEKLINLAKN